MQYEKQKLDGFYICGKEVLTSNSENVFSEVWSEFLKNCKGGQPIAVYTNYESDFSGKFNFVVGVISEKTENAKFYEGGLYAKFHLETKEKLLGCWQFIWQSKIDRAYTADFELYNEDGSVDVYIAIKSEIESRCGLKCGECVYKAQVNCKGCTNIEKPFWSEGCPVKNCCEGRKLKNCGACEEFPCELLNQFAYDKEQGDNGKRIENCMGWCGNHNKDQ